MTGRRVEWPTLALLALCYGSWASATTVLAAAVPVLGFVVTTLAIALHSSLTHEIIHGHPFPGRTRLNAGLAWPTLGLFVPYGRFRDQHLAHHNDAILTDPYDDPESNYLDPEVWGRLPRPVRLVLRANNTLIGRIVLGPAISLSVFAAADLSDIRTGDRRVLASWFWHLPQIAPVLIWLWAVSALPVWAYLLAAYLGLGIIKIRTFLEHQAHERASGRSVIIEDKGPLAWMFLNNNLHAVHHMHPKVPWYELPGLYGRNRARYLRRNGGYAYRSYAEVFGRHLFRRKDPVPHPLYRG